MRWLLPVSIVGCASQGTGTVVCSEGSSAHILTVDVASGAQTTLDLGAFGDVAIAPDRQHVVYLGQDGIPKLADLQGNVVPLRPTGGCNGPFAWTGNALSYCVAEPDGLASIAFMPEIGAPARALPTSAVAIASDSARIAYLRRPANGANGDLVVETALGGDPTVLRASTQLFNVAFLPDGSGLLVVDVPPDAQSVLHLARVDLADGRRTDLGAGTLPDVVPGGSRFSPDGREALAVVNGALVALDLASGATRRFSTLGSTDNSIVAAFLDADRVLSARIGSVFEGDVGGQTASVRISDGTKETVIVASDGSNQCGASAVDVGTRLIAVVCAVPAIIDFEGRLVASRKASAVLGLAADGSGMVSLSPTGSVELVGIDGSVKLLATALTPDFAAPSSLVGPFAAYAP